MVNCKDFPLNELFELEPFISPSLTHLQKHSNLENQISVMQYKTKLPFKKFIVLSFKH